VTGIMRAVSTRTHMIVNRTRDSAHRRVQESKNHNGIELTRHDVELVGLPPEQSGITIVQISDFHRGCGNPDALITTAVGCVNALEPDYVVITGDFIDGRRKDILPVVKLVSGLCAKRGTFAVLGNHDQRADPELLRTALEAANINVLDNRNVELSPGLWIAGIDDMREGRPDLDKALNGIPERAGPILLSHIPNVFQHVSANRPMLILSGHTHGGQLNIPFLTPYVVCRIHLNTPFVHGWYQNGNVRMYVNRGIGVTGPNPLNRRFRCPPEITEFRLICPAKD